MNRLLLGDVSSFVASRSPECSAKLTLIHDGIINQVKSYRGYALILACPVIVHTERQQSQHRNLKDDVPSGIEALNAVLGNVAQ